MDSDYVSKDDPQKLTNGVDGGDVEMELLNGDVELGDCRVSSTQPTGEHGRTGNTNISLTYGIDDIPPWYLSIILGLQHYLTMFGGTLSIPLLLSTHLCVGDNYLATSQILGTILFVAGISTFLQCTFGVRLPILQGGTFALLTPTIAILSLPDWKCPEGTNGTTAMRYNYSLPRGLDYQYRDDNLDDPNEIWKIRMREIQGAIMVASIFQVVFGFSGLIGILMRFIGPLSIAPTITLVGLALIEPAALHASKHWGVAFMTMALIIIFSQYLRNIDVPLPGWDRTRGCHFKRIKFFMLFPVILAISVSWLVCCILTATDVFPTDPKHPNYNARTDARIEVLYQAPWIWFPYPGQWGKPTVSFAGVFGMISGVLASMIESVGDYYACARLSGAPPPPIHAINRGIGTEGICCVLAGIWGSGNGTTSYSENIGAIGITKVASRRVLQFCSLILIIFAVFGKFGALFTTIPEPVVGGVLCVMFGMITAVGVSNLQFVDMNSARNLCIFGFATFVGLMLPIWLGKEENRGVIDTGNREVDQIITVLLSTSMFVGGFLGFVLDNTVPGTKEERGLINWQKQMTVGSRDIARNEDDVSVRTYDFPVGMSFIRKWKWTQYIPFCPTFKFSKRSD
ncbi:solute carrier family 23 member 1-like [Saccoglossus kowalevskii]|uniref:Solute carrier family 23 member 1-like n=1 Tax=Saccoglossus kowalevskii TaxID=10224 RepID=A0ABM0M5D7_SACKO|nr:PREDICTED: solute carrier family 23 member 1-like [Saccoglossus kowalevskii]